ncbi:remorin 4.1-like [Magnolia sinica]|uniref:remorin 4.1-like n=1 Tax=Magnolia sinica TaxID=86752 RepID=UPI0026588317|nr:remorin 4.1-like [Magnolia sinica]
MLGNDQSTTNGDDPHEDEIRDIHAVTPPQPVTTANRARRREAWETGSHRSSNLSTSSEVLSENFTTMSREFNALVLAGSTAVENGSSNEGPNTGPNLARIGEELEETNPLAIVPDNSPMDPVPSPRRVGGSSSSSSSMNNNITEEVSLHRVKKEEIETKISAWQTAEIAKINNRFKREDAIINGCESEEVQKATMRLKKVERKLEEKRAKATEKMQNKVAKSHQKAEEKRASAEAKRGTKVARILEIANLMRTVGRAPSKRSFF